MFPGSNQSIYCCIATLFYCCVKATYLPGEKKRTFWRHYCAKWIVKLHSSDANFFESGDDWIQQLKPACRPVDRIRRNADAFDRRVALPGQCIGLSYRRYIHHRCASHSAKRDKRNYIRHAPVGTTIVIQDRRLREYTHAHTHTSRLILSHYPDLAAHRHARWMSRPIQPPLFPSHQCRPDVRNRSY